MTAVAFDRANTVFNPPSDMDESQCEPVPAFAGQMEGGNLDGANVVTVAWKPTQEDIYKITEGAPIFLTCIGGLPPHFLTTHFPFK